MAIQDINENLTPILDFERIESKVKDIANYKQFFKGQHELLTFYELIKGIESGDIDKEKYGKKQMPPMSTCRWHTTFMRVLALYIRTPNPSESMKELVKYIMQAYGPACFDIVCNPEVHSGTHHFFNFIKNSIACLKEENWNNIKKYFSLNG